MPQSNPFNIPWIIQLLSQINPNSILDIGIGNGSYGFLCRQYLDIAKRRLRKEEWKTIINGIEIFPEYKNPIWDYFYDNVIIGDVLDIVKEIRWYDVILLLDVIEHFSKSNGNWLVNELLKKTDYLLISTPKGKYDQGEVYGNTHETHLSEWSASEFDSHYVMNFDIDACQIFVICTEKEKIGHVNRHKIPVMFKPSMSLRSVLKNHLFMIKSKINQSISSKKR